MLTHCRWQSDDGLKFIDFDVALSSRFECALTSGQLHYHLAEKNWLFDFTAMTQTNVLVRRCHFLSSPSTFLFLMLTMKFDFSATDIIQEKHSTGCY
jgi:hypothetical protein